MPAPVALFAYNRPDHIKLTLDALARNTLADQTNLYIFSDGPKSERDAAAVAEVRNVVGTVSGFSSITLVERPANMGLANSVISGVTELLEKYESIIVLEDDLVTSQWFLAYMNEALEHYRNDAMAFSVTGHTFPATYLKIPPDYPFDTYAGYRCSSWSWGTWRDRWQRIDWSMDYYPEFANDVVAQDLFNRGGQDMTTILAMQFNGKIDSWAIRFCYAHYVNDMRCIYPTRTLVKNIGLDNSGTHSKPDPRFLHSELDGEWRPRDFCKASSRDERIVSSFRAIFDSHSPSRDRLPLRKIKNLFQILLRHTRHVALKVSRIVIRPVQDVDVLVLNTYEKNGGAARAAWRIYGAIRKKYSSAIYLTLFREDYSPGVVGLINTTVRGAIAQHLVRLDQRPLRSYPDRLMSFFSPAIRPNPLRIPLSRFRPKLAHLHWVGHGMLRVEEIGKLRCPVIWTLHDTWAFTGGCHYTGACTGFRQECGNCPQLMSGIENDISRRLMQRKAHVFRDVDMTIVAPSHWLANLAASSSLFVGRRIEVIPNGLDANVYKPIDQSAARAYFGIENKNPVILFGAHWLPDPRKGGDLLAAALANLDCRCTLLTFGEGEFPLENAPKVQLRSLGSLSDDASLALAYSAADVFACPSREDNLPNTVAEAMACGTPCAAFSANGLPDMIAHRVDGWLAQAFDPADLAAGLRWLTTHPRPDELRRAARAKALSEYSLEVMSARYESLYTELLSTNSQ